MSILKNFTAAAATAAFASADQNWHTIEAIKDGSSMDLYWEKHSDWIDAYPNNGGLVLGMNSNVFIHDYPYDGQYWAFKPYVRGGSVEYDVDVSTFGCGCVAGLYAVALNDEQCSEDVKTGRPNCPHIDVMQANPFGFNTSAHPCANG